MAACGEPGEDAELYATVRAVGVELCAALGITIPVGKDSLSMRTAWSDARGEHSVVAPVSLVVSAFAPVADVRRTLTPELDLSAALAPAADRSRRRQEPPRRLVLGAGVRAARAAEPPDLDDPALLRAFFAAVRELKDRDCCSPITTAPTAACW